jgi:hypothetical protein
MDFLILNFLQLDYKRERGRGSRRNISRPPSLLTAALKERAYLLGIEGLLFRIFSKGIFNPT